jgi:hypothetical protein
MVEAPPPPVSLAGNLLWASLGFGVIRTGLDWPAIERAAPVAFVVPAMVLTLVVAVWLIVMILKRRNWARIVFLVLFVIGTLMDGPGVFGEIVERPVQGLCGLAQILLQGAALFLLFRPSAAAWFRPAGSA